jgi:hypothetical protein
VQSAIRSSLAQIRHSRIAPSAITAPPMGFVPPSLGVPVPPSEPSSSENKPHERSRGLQEERVERDAWKGILRALTGLRDATMAEEKVSLNSTKPGIVTDHMQDIETDPNA